MICDTDARRCSAPWLQVVWVPFRGGLASTNPLVSVDCQASRPTHSTMWVYSAIWDIDCICPLRRPEEPLKNTHEPKVTVIYCSLLKKRHVNSVAFIYNSCELLSFFLFSFEDTSSTVCVGMLINKKVHIIVSVRWIRPYIRLHCLLLRVGCWSLSQHSMTSLVI